MRKIIKILILTLFLCMLQFNTDTFASSQSSSNTSKETICTTFEEAAEVLRQGMKDREETIEISYQGSSNPDNEALKNIFQMAISHTGNPTEGDYLKFQYASMNGNITSYKGVGNPTTYSATFLYTVSYYTTSEEESEMDDAVSALLSELNLEGKSDYEKVSVIYDYICNQIVYDHENVDDDSYTLKYTGYAALVNKKAICQGYAVLLYRLLLEEGIDTRIISGIAGGVKHAWNIVKLKDCYYNLDCTWDADYWQNGSDYKCFLKNEENFINHTRNSAYTTDTFIESYPISLNDYHEWDDGSVTKDATCTENGTITYTCEVCGATKTEDIPSTGHSFTSYTYNNDATYTADGTETALCDNGCGQKKTKTVSGTMKKLVSSSISSIVNTSGGVKLTWKKVTGASGYYIYRKISSASSYTKIKTVSGASIISYTDTKAVNGTKYYYKVTAFNSVQKVSSSACFKIRLSTNSVAKLLNLSGRKLRVTWKKNSKASGYQIRYALSSSFKTSKTITVTSYKTVSKTITNLKKGKTYYVKIRAYKTLNGKKYYSGYSSSKKIKINK